MTIQSQLNAAYLDGLNGEPYKCPYTGWNQMSIAARHLNEYMKGDEARTREGLEKDWRRKLDNKSNPA